MPPVATEQIDRRLESVLLERRQADFIEIQSTLRLVQEEYQEARDACFLLLDVASG